MDTNKLVGMLAPLVGLKLVGIVDPRKQDDVDQAMAYLMGWKLVEVLEGTVKLSDRVTGETDVHLRFRDGGRSPDFCFSLNSPEVERVKLIQGQHNAVAIVLFEEGHSVTLSLAR